MAEGFTRPDERIRAPSMFDWVSRKIGEHIFSTGGTEGYETVGRDPEKKEYYGDVLEKGEDQLTRIAFKMEPTEEVNKVFTKIGSTEGGGDILKVDPESNRGAQYQGFLNQVFTQSVTEDFYKYKGDASKAKKDLITQDPDSGQISYKYKETTLGDVYVDESKGFADYWNFGLDKGEQLNKINILRLGAAPFSKPPTVKGKVKVSSQHLQDYKGIGKKEADKLSKQINKFYNDLFKVSTEDKVIEKFKEDDEFSVKKEAKVRE